MEERGLIICTPQKDVSDHSKTEYQRDDFTNDKKADDFVCPCGKCLTFRTLQRAETGIYRVYRADAKTCEYCPYRDKCLAPGQKLRKI